MICYRDKTWCTFYEDCNKANECPDPLTHEVKENADKWWAKIIKGDTSMDDGTPICVWVEKPKCHSDFDNKEE